MDHESVNRWCPSRSTYDTPAHLLPTHVVCHRAADHGGGHEALADGETVRWETGKVARRFEWGVRAV